MNLKRTDPAPILAPPSYIPRGTPIRSVRLSDEDWDRFQKLGGREWLEAVIRATPLQRGPKPRVTRS